MCTLYFALSGKAQFDLMDSDASGTLDFFEIAENIELVCESGGIALNTDAASFWAMADEDGSRAVDRDEFHEVMMGLKTGTRQVVQHVKAASVAPDSTRESSLSLLWRRHT